MKPFCGIKKKMEFAELRDINCEIEFASHNSDFSQNSESTHLFFYSAVE